MSLASRVVALSGLLSLAVPSVPAAEIFPFELVKPGMVGKGRTVFAGLPQAFTATRYHSLVIAPDSMPACLEVSARTADGVIMGVRHRDHSLEGVQFHPESILTTAGKDLLANFLRIANGSDSPERTQRAQRP